MNHIHREAGGPNGSQCSMNDSDIRALAQDFSGEISFSDTRGGATLTQGASGTSIFWISWMVLKETVSLLLDLSQKLVK